MIGMTDMPDSIGTSERWFFMNVKSPIRMGECRGHWEWGNGSPKCLAGNKGDASIESLSAAYKSWDNRDKLLFLSDVCLTQCLQDANQARPPAMKHWVEPRKDRFADQVVSIAHEVNPLPRVPDEATEHFLMGNSILSSVKNAEDLGKVEEEYEEAVRLAPWWGEAYYNLASCEELEGFYLFAVKNYNYYIQLNPPSSDAQLVRSHIQGLEEKAERERPH